MPPREGYLLRDRLLRGKEYLFCISLDFITGIVKITLRIITNIVYFYYLIDNTLLFIDEIQESTEAIQMLRHFYEEFPDLQVIAAGSLLEFTIKSV
jgi:predicted AAA+ superfamily ATPase